MIKITFIEKDETNEAFGEEVYTICESLEEANRIIEKFGITPLSIEELQ